MVYDTDLLDPLCRDGIPPGLHRSAIFIPDCILLVTGSFSVDVSGVFGT